MIDCTEDAWKDSPDALPIVSREEFFAGRAAPPPRQLVPKKKDEIKPAPTPNEPKQSPMVRLRQIMFSELMDLHSGRSDPQRAIAASKLAAQIISAVRLEVDSAGIYDAD